MLKDVTQYVFDAGQAAGKKTNANILDRLCDPRTIVYELNGKIEQRDIPPPLRAHKVDSVGDLIAAAQRWSREGVIWLSAESAELVADDTDRRDRVTLPLCFSHVFQTLKSLGDHANSRMDQVTLIRLLRREFRKSPGASTLLASVRKIKFRSAKSGYSDLQHGNESLGNTIEAEVTGADGIAETMLVPTNIYSNPGEEDNVFSVTLDLEIDVEKQKFVLRPMPDEIEAAIATALDSIKTRLNDALGEPVLFGKP